MKGQPPLPCLSPVTPRPSHSEGQNECTADEGCGGRGTGCMTLPHPSLSPLREKDTASPSTAKETQRHGAAPQLGRAQPSSRRRCLLPQGLGGAQQAFSGAAPCCQDPGVSSQGSRGGRCRQEGRGSGPARRTHHREWEAHQHHDGVVQHHEELLVQVAAHHSPGAARGAGLPAMLFDLVLVPVAEEHGVDVIDEVGHCKLRVGGGQPVSVGQREMFQGGPVAGQSWAPWPVRSPVVLANTPQDTTGLLNSG